MTSRSSDTRRGRAPMRCDGLEKSLMPGSEGGRKRKQFHAERETEFRPPSLKLGLCWNHELLRPCVSLFRATPTTQWLADILLAPDPYSIVSPLHRRCLPQPFWLGKLRHPPLSPSSRRV